MLRNEEKKEVRVLIIVFGDEEEDSWCIVTRPKDPGDFRLSAD